jgi:predicted hydrolase (HD superfamily)
MPISLPSRQQTQQLLEKYITNEALIHHSQMVAEAMQAYALKLDQDEELWYQTGLLHDLDWEMYPDEHPNKAVNDLLSDYPAQMLQAIKAHAPERTGISASSQLDCYLFACDELSGFLHAYSLMRPTGFTSMKPGKVMKRLHDKSFAANVNRDDIMLGFSLIKADQSDHIQFLIEVFSQS